MELFAIALVAASFGIGCWIGHRMNERDRVVAFMKRRLEGKS